MKYFLDTEFIEDGITIDLISLALVAESGKSLYLLNKDCDYTKADDWIRDNVLSHLPPRPPETDMTVMLNSNDGIWCPRKSFAPLIESFIGEDKPEFWAYHADYDWVAFCQSWGRMIDIPKSFPKYCLDLKQLALSKGIQKLPKQESNEHNALADANWNFQQYNQIKGL